MGWLVEDLGGQSAAQLLRALTLQLASPGMLSWRQQDMVRASLVLLALCKPQSDHFANMPLAQLNHTAEPKVGVGGPHIYMTKSKDTGRVKNQDHLCNQSTTLNITTP